MKFTSTLLFVLLVFGVGQAQTSKKSRPKPAAQAPAAESDREISKEILELEETMRRAAINGDSTWWDLHLDENFVGLDADGRVINRTEAIQLHNSKDLKYDNIYLHDMTIRTFNKDTIVINGKTDVEGTFQNQNIGGNYNFLRIWVKEGQDWKLAASSVSRIPRGTQGGKPE